MSIVKRVRPGWPFVEEEEQQKKWQGQGYQIEEEARPQQVEDEVHEADFYEGDTDDDDIEDPGSRYKTVEYGFWDDNDTTPLQDEKEEDRNCLKVPICNKHHHPSKFRGLPLFELFKVKLRLNENSTSLEGPLYGSIELFSTPENPFPSPENPNRITYFRASKKDPYSITLDPGKSIILPLSNPKPRPPIAEFYWLDLNFAFKFENEDVFQYGCGHEDYELFDDGHGNHTATYRLLSLFPNSIPWGREDGPCVRRVVFGQPDSRFIMAAHCSAYRGAWASVDVKILKKGVTSFYGFVYARPCIFHSRIPLLLIRPDQKLELQQASQSLELTRSDVAVPSFSSLIVVVILYDQHDNLIVRGKTFFPASPNGRVEKLIGEGDVCIEVKWACRG